MLTGLTYNILRGGYQREDALTAIITAAQPDVVLLQELFDEALLRRVAGALHADYFYARGNRRFHLGLISGLPIRAAQSYCPLPICTTLLEATLALPGGHPLHLWGVHLMPNLGAPFELWRRAEVGVLLRRTRTKQHEPCLIAGDCNAIAPGERVLVHGLPSWLRWVVLAQGGRTYSWALGALRRHGWVDCFRQLHPRVAGWTLPSHKPNARLDYIFANPLLASHLQECAIISAPPQVRTASDHLPVRARFALRDI